MEIYSKHAGLSSRAKPTVTLHMPSRRWHLAKVLFEKSWLYLRL